MSTVCLASKKDNVQMGAAFAIKASVNISNGSPLRLSSSSSVKAINSIDIFRSAKLKAEAKLDVFSNMSMNVKELKRSAEGNIRANPNLRQNGLVKAGSVSRINLKRADKFLCATTDIGAVKKFQATEKLYPIKDIVINQNNSYFINRSLNTNNLFDSIDEGVFIGSYLDHGGSGKLIADDESYIQPSSVFTKGNFRYQCEVTPPQSDTKNTILAFRAYAPLSDRSSNIPPQYKLSNIKLEDPSGNLIAQYRNILLRGDGQFATYISEPIINNVGNNQWQSGYPLFGLPSGYKLNIDFEIDCLDDPFSEGFSIGYEDTCNPQFVYVSGSTNEYLAIDGAPLSTQSQGFTLNPNTSIRISAIEILSSGGIGIQKETYLPFYEFVDATGVRKNRNIMPAEVVQANEQNVLYPSVKSIWKTNITETQDYLYNLSGVGSAYLTSKLQGDEVFNFISLAYNDPPVDSGRLTLKFSHKPPDSVASYVAGAFTFGSQSKDFDTAELQNVSETDSFFTVDKVELIVLAKKSAGTNNYHLDVVGYSNDGILNITSRKNAFLQNANVNDYHANGSIPSISGLYSAVDLGISIDSVSNKSQYFTQPEITNPAGDHYLITNVPTVSSTVFQEYTIPLHIYEDDIILGKSKDYSVSSYFENLYLDLYPIPSGASIASAYLNITYKPSNALVLHSVGQSQDVELAPRRVALYPTSSANTSLINSISSSSISGLPHRFNTSNTISNYGTRWRGVDGNVVWGPFDPNQFSVDFYNPPSDRPFIYGYYDFSDVSNSGATPAQNTITFINSDNIPHLNTPYANNAILISGSILRTITHNHGWRLSGSTLDYAANSNSPLQNKIFDNFDRSFFLNANTIFLKTLATQQNFNYKDGFAIFYRFIPSTSTSVNENLLFTSGNLFCLGSGDFVSNNRPEFSSASLCYRNGYLTAIATDQSNNSLTIQDSVPYSGYTYPLSVLLTYNENGSKKLKLYTDNESSDTFNILRAESNSFDILSNGTSANSINFMPVSSGGLLFGHPIYITDIGISDSCNIISSGNINRLTKQTYAQSLFDSVRSRNNSRYKLYDFVNEDIRGWELGDYNYTQFSADFSRIQKRAGTDYLVHKVVSSGNPYAVTINNPPLISGIDLSGVSYHSQIENDFLRFSLSDVDDNFVFAKPRISKNLPRGYNFEERALAIESIVEHDTFNNIIWPDQNIGPKLIVSLYAPSKDDSNRPSIKNLGLINRSIHYLKPSGSIHKIKSSFRYEDILNRSEPWSNFAENSIISEFDHRLYQYDINSMFLQYDIAYPSGSPYKSKIKLHTVNVIMDNAYFKSKDENNQINLVASGDKSVVNTITLHTNGLSRIDVGVNLVASGSPTPSSQGILNFNINSSYFENTNLNLFALNIGRISTLSNNEIASGVYQTYTEPVSLYNSGRFSQFDDQVLPLYAKTQESYPSTNGTISLCVINKIPETLENRVNIFVRGRSSDIDPVSNSTMSMFTDGLVFSRPSSNSFNLYIKSEGKYETVSDSFGLYTINYQAFNQQVSQQGVIIWDSSNVGKSITSLDNSMAFLDANDEIRGVDIICYGVCTDE